MRVSIGIPFFNAEQTLLDSVRSVFAQTFRDWELILIDDGSEDHSLDIAMSISDPRVRVVSDGRNHGLQSRLNEIAQLARGELLARMDADDIMHPDRLRRQVEYLDTNPFVDVVGCAVYTIDALSALTGIRHDEPIDTRPASVLRGGFICHPTALGKAEWFRRNPYDESFVAAEDHELFSRAAHASCLARLPEPLFYYRETHKNPRTYLRRYALHNHHIRRCYVRYGPSTVGWAATAAMMVRSWTKVAVYTAATAVGAQDAVISRRNGRQLTEIQRQHAEAGLTIVRDTVVPGIPSQAEAWYI